MFVADELGDRAICRLPVSHCFHKITVDYTVYPRGGGGCTTLPTKGGDRKQKNTRTCAPPPNGLVHGDQDKLVYELGAPCFVTLGSICTRCYVSHRLESKSSNDGRYHVLFICSDHWYQEKITFIINARAYCFVLFITLLTLRRFPRHAV